MAYRKITPEIREQIHKRRFKAWHYREIEHKTYREIGEIMGVSGQRIRQLVRKYQDYIEWQVRIAQGRSNG